MVQPAQQAQALSIPRFWSLTGLTSYEEARALQLRLVDLRARDEIADTVLFLEHRPVITRGRGLQFSPTSPARERQMPAPTSLPPGTEFAESERGGDLTYHGPGQLVMYPIVKLTDHDVTAFLRRLERVMITLLGDLGLQAESREHATGVWVGEHKVASVGIAVRKWVVYHGIAINVVNDLKPFHLISPCGFNPEVMSTLQALGARLGADEGAEAGEWRAGLEQRIAALFAPGAGAQVVSKSCAEFQRELAAPSR